MKDADEDGRGDLYVDTTAGIVAEVIVMIAMMLCAFTSEKSFQSVSSGTFTMGSLMMSGRDNDEDQHEATLTQDFEIWLVKSHKNNF